MLKFSDLSASAPAVAKGSSLSGDSSAALEQDPYAFANLTPYVHPPETTEDLFWSDLVTLDLSDFTKPGGKQRLASQLSDAVQKVGFFYVKNFGLSQEQIDRQLTLAKNFFSLPFADKQQYSVDYEKGDYNGYRWGGYRADGSQSANNHGDNIEAYNIPKFIPELAGKYAQPPLLQRHHAEIAAFTRHLHEHIVAPLMVLFGIILELPREDLLQKMHSYDQLSDDHYRYMKYSRRTPEQHRASDGVQVKGHSDLGSLTLLFRQPVAGLQILGDDWQWRYVRPLPGTVTVNLADTLSLLTGGFFKSSIHRVVAPPRDQWGYDRLGLLYFARPHNDTVLRPLVSESPVLQRNRHLLTEGFTRPITMAEFTVAKQRMLLNPHLYEEKRDQHGDVELIAGFKDHRYV
ncbi:UPF0676 protein [Penicillium diatomitis]|uniref:UPF0676 protein n=1 Tax=Penicillium diatomitis TaxID=2819901 RepID=A0A9W9X555_9EURO|nr:UPF0676 protein [Penicillium diatomitis]KAJ5483810.1 UPF0676 protein [Penicillium diatomitis]